MNGEQQGSSQSRRRRPGWIVYLLPVLALALALPACNTRQTLRGNPIVSQQRAAPNRDVLQRVAVIPFHADASVRPPANAAPDWVPARPVVTVQIETFVSDALVAQGLDVISPGEVQSRFTADGQAVPSLDAQAAADLSRRSFEATGVILGRVMRWREREGGAAGASRPASVAFEVSLFDARSGRRVWTGRFDQTQPSVTDDILTARQYPGAGSRWLSAEELARWGAERTVRSLVSDGGGS